MTERLLYDTARIVSRIRQAQTEILERLTVLLFENPPPWRVNGLLQEIQIKAQETISLLALLERNINDLRVDRSAESD